jgi:hypothetical protein
MLATKLNIEGEQVAHFLALINQVRGCLVINDPLLTSGVQQSSVLSQDQDSQVRREIAAMMARLDAARHKSRDLPDGPTFEVTQKLAARVVPSSSLIQCGYHRHPLFALMLTSLHYWGAVPVLSVAGSSNTGSRTQACPFFGERIYLTVAIS